MVDKWREQERRTGEEVVQKMSSCHPIQAAVPALRNSKYILVEYLLSEDKLCVCRAVKRELYESE